MTTALAELVKGASFTWGKLVQIHRVGRYAIVEHRPWTTSGVNVNVGRPGRKVEFHAYVDGKDISYAYDTLEAALAGAMAYKWDNINSQAGDMFMRMLPRLKAVA